MTAFCGAKPVLQSANTAHPLEPSGFIAGAIPRSPARDAPWVADILAALGDALQAFYLSTAIPSSEAVFTTISHLMLPLRQHYKSAMTPCHFPKQ